MAFFSGFGTTLNVGNPGDAWFRRARGPRNQTVAERGYLPCDHHRGIHVILPCEPWIAVLGSTWDHSQEPPHCLGICTLFPLFLPALDSTLAHFSSIISVFSSRHCVFHAPASLDAAGKSFLAALKAGTCAGSRALVSLASFFRVASLHLAPLTLSFACFTTFLWILTIRCGA